MTGMLWYITRMHEGTPEQPILEHAAKALIINPTTQEILILQEASTGKENTNIDRWGVPGGRLEPGESHEDALKREVKEETGLIVSEIGELIHEDEWGPIINGVWHKVLAKFMLCRTRNFKVVLNKESKNYLWISPAHRSDYDIKIQDARAIDKIAGQLS